MVPEKSADAGTKPAPAAKTKEISKKPSASTTSNGAVGGASSKGANGASPAGASKAAELGLAAMNKKSSSSTSNPTITPIPTAAARQPRTGAAHSTSNPNPFLQTGAAFGSKPTPPKAKEFNVTHLSSNWDLRRAPHLQAAVMEKSRNNPTAAAPIINTPAPTTRPNAATTTRPNAATQNGRSDTNLSISTNAPRPAAKRSVPDTSHLTAPTVSTLNKIKSLELQKKEKTVVNDDKHKEQQKFLEKERTKVEIKKSILAEKQKAVTSSLIDDRTSRKEDKAGKVSKTPDEGYAEESPEEVFKRELAAYEESKDDRSSGFSESMSRKKKSKSGEDFDTDFTDSGSDSEASSSEQARKSDKTLNAYLISCSKNGLKPNRTFMRQCGRPSIDMRNRMLTSKEAKSIAVALVDDRRTSSVDLSDNPLGSLGTSYIAEMMSANESIMELNLSNTDPGTEGLSALSQHLPNNKNLKTLTLDHNKLQEGDGRHLAKLVTNVPDLRELHLNHTSLGFKDGTRLALALASDEGNLNHLSLQYNNIRTESAVQLALSLGKNTTLKRLNLGWNGFGEDGCRALAKSLGENSTLRELDLTNNRLGIKSLEPLVDGLKKNMGLTRLKLGTNPMTTEGAKAVMVALSQAPDSTVEELDVQGIPIDQEFLDLKEKIQQVRDLEVIHDQNVQLGTSHIAKEHEGVNLDHFDPVMVLFEYMKKDNLRVIDLFQFFDQKKRDKLSRKDLKDGVNTLQLPFTEHALDVIVKGLDKNRDGFISLDEMMRGYKTNESIVKQRRIKASRKKKPDRGLEELWTILKDLIAKRKAENEKRTKEASGKTGKT